MGGTRKKDVRKGPGDSSDHIDWLLYKSGRSLPISPSRCEVITDKKPDGGFPSDHHAVITTFTIGSQQKRSLEDPAPARAPKRLAGIQGAPTPAPTPATPTPWATPTPLPSSQASTKHQRPEYNWQHVVGKNCFDGFGGTNVDLRHDNKHPLFMQIQDAKKLCEQQGLAGFTYDTKSGRMWRLSRITDPKRFKSSSKFDVYILRS